MRDLSAAHKGYEHQDVVTAFALASIIFPQPILTSVTADRKVPAPGDCFDDLELEGKARRRIQIKSSQATELQLSDLKTKAMSFRLDRAIRSVVEDGTPADEYRLLTTHSAIADDLREFVRVDALSSPALPEFPTACFRLLASHIWPAGSAPVWPHLDGLGRDALEFFCDRFVLEIGCARTSGDFRAPGPLERTLLSALEHRVGIGTFPNHNRDLADAAAALGVAAKKARASGSTFKEEDVIRALALRVDYGRIVEEFPVDERQLIEMSDEISGIHSSLNTGSRLAITGSPGAGKSWLLYQVADSLRAAGWIVATHYCFIDPLDLDSYERATIDTTFGSLMATVRDACPDLMSVSAPRFAAGPREFEQLLQASTGLKPRPRVAIIVDGLDHIDRLPELSRTDTAGGLVEELAALELPENAVLLVGSQPGRHLDYFLGIGLEHSVGAWPDHHIREIGQRMNLAAALTAGGLDQDIEETFDVIVQKACGNPLYGTYLTKTALALADQQNESRIVDSLAGYLASAPAFDDDINAYYKWLVADDLGVRWTARFLSLIEFPVSAAELEEIDPRNQADIDRVLGELAPVLVGDRVGGEIRIYHESFQRFMREQVPTQEEVAAHLKPAVDWLKSRGFLVDRRAFRWLLALLRRSGRHREVVDQIEPSFVALATMNAQPADAVLANIDVAAASAADLKDWPAIVRLLEVGRAADHMYRWRLDADQDLAREYGLAYLAIFGARAMNSRLIHDKRCSFPPRYGLLLCQLCDAEGETPPWDEYLTSFERERRSTNTAYGAEHDEAISLARLTGLLRRAGSEGATAKCIDWLEELDLVPVHPYDIPVALGRAYGEAAIEAVIKSLPKCEGRAWAHLALAKMRCGASAKRQAEDALNCGLPEMGWRACLRIGVASEAFPAPLESLQELTQQVLSPGIQFDVSVLSTWLTRISLAAALPAEDTLNDLRESMPADSWFHRWLRFCFVLVDPQTTQDGIVGSLQELSEDIEVFRGDPRVCDLYGLGSEIERSFAQAIVQLDDDRWSKAAASLARISAGTATTLFGSRNGPLGREALFNILLDTANSVAKKRAASDLAAEIIPIGDSRGTHYDNHAHDYLLLTRLHMAAGRCEKAEESWQESCKCLIGYGWRKDVTVFELLDPIPALASVDPLRARRCLKDVQPAVYRVLVHTDGSETRHAIHKWIDLVASIHPAGALSYLAHENSSQTPSFCDLDHAFPEALKALSSENDKMAGAIGWLSVGSEARKDPKAALSGCESAAMDHSAVGRMIWTAVIASLDGDGEAPAKDLASHASDSAALLGVSVPEIEEPTSRSQEDAVTVPRTRGNSRVASPRLAVPFLRPTASASQIAHAVRNWHRGGSSNASVDQVANAVGWRLIGMVQDGDEASAETLVRRLALETSPVDRDALLSSLAQGLMLRGAQRLACLASVFAYTRGSNPHLTFGGDRRLYLDGITIDASLSWSVLADEVVRHASSASIGRTSSVIELLVATGRGDDAFLAWSEANAVIETRLPRTGADDDVDVPYDLAVDDVWEAVATASASRINHCFVHEKRLALTASALFVRRRAELVRAAIRHARASRSIWTLIVLLQLVYEFEPEPYEASRALTEDLRVLATSDLVSARVLARKLLDRAEHCPRSKTTPASPKGLATPGSAPEQLRDCRIDRVDSMLPGFNREVTGGIRTLRASDNFRHRMGKLGRRLDLNPSTDRQLEFWSPLDESLEELMQSTGSSMTASGGAGADHEEKVGMGLLGNVEITVRLGLSRILRPEYIPAPSSSEHRKVLVKEPIQLLGTEFNDWFLAASYESVVAVGSEWNKLVKARFTVWSGIVISEEDHDGSLPVGYGNPAVWSASDRVRSAPFAGGPLVGFNHVADPFGAIAVLAPHEGILSLHKLLPASVESGLTLVDENGKSAVVCRAWKRRYIGGPEADREFKSQGLMVLLRDDIYHAICSSLAAPVQFITVAPPASFVASPSPPT